MDVGDASGIVSGMESISNTLYSAWFWAVFFLGLIVLYVFLRRRRHGGEE